MESLLRHRRRDPEPDQPQQHGRHDRAPAHDRPEAHHDGEGRRGRVDHHVEGPRTTVPAAPTAPPATAPPTTDPPATAPPTAPPTRPAADPAGRRPPAAVVDPQRAPVAEPAPALLARTVLLEVMARYGLEPHRTLGQNFVVDQNTIRKIVRLAGVGDGDRVVEIGPGLGSLTLGLLEAGATVTAVEIDTRLIEPLTEITGGRATMTTPSPSTGRRSSATTTTWWSPTCPTTSRPRWCCACSTRFPGCGGSW